MLLNKRKRNPEKISPQVGANQPSNNWTHIQERDRNPQNGNGHLLSDRPQNNLRWEMIEIINQEETGVNCGYVQMLSVEPKI